VKHISLFCKEYSANPAWYDKPLFRIGPYWIGFNLVRGGACNYDENPDITKLQSLLVDSAGMLVNAALALLGWCWGDWTQVGVNLFLIGVANDDVKCTLSTLTGWPSMTGLLITALRGAIMLPMLWTLWTGEMSWCVALIVLGNVYCVANFLALILDMRDTIRQSSGGA